MGMGLSLLPGGAAGAAEPGIVFVSDRDGEPEIFTMRPDGTQVVQLTSNLFWDTDPSWSPDAARLVFSSNRDGDDDIYLMNRDGTGVVNISNSGAGKDVQPDWAPDGTKIVFVRDGNIYVVSATSGAEPTRIGRGRSPAWSPDGTKIALAKPERGSSDIYVMNADGSGSRAVTSGLDADSPDWSPNGAKIVFESTALESDESRLMTMNADGSNLFQLPGTGDDYSPSWSPDGTKLVFTNIILDAEIMTTAVNGTGRTVLASHPAYDVLPSWTLCQGAGCSGASPTPTASTTASPTVSPSGSPTVSPTTTPGPGTKSATRTVLQFLRTRRYIKAAGRVTPAHPGTAVKVLLSKRRNARWVNVALKLPQMNSEGAFQTRFRNPARTRRCRLIARFPGDQDHLASRRVVSFRC
jgi:TolB protein